MSAQLAHCMKASAYSSGRKKAVNLSHISRLSIMSGSRSAGWDCRQSKKVFALIDRGSERTFVLWNSGPEDIKVAVQRSAETARLLDMYGNELPLQQSGQNWLIDLGKATRHFSLFGGDPADYFFVGSPPVFLIEYSPSEADPIAPRLATDTDIAAEVAAPTPEVSLPSQGDDYGIANGHFYPQARGDRPLSFGYTIVDDALCPCFTQFIALGGVAALGYPASQPYQEGGFVYQATQGALLQWDPATGQMNFANIFDILSANDFDDRSACIGN